MFTAEHFIWIALCAAFIAAMTLISRRRNWSLRRAGCVMTAICIISEVSKIMSNMQASPYGGMVLDPLSLPFHLCSLMIFAVAGLLRLPAVELQGWFGASMVGDDLPTLLSLVGMAMVILTNLIVRKVSPEQSLF